MNKNFADDALRGLLGRRVPAWARYALVLLATAVFAVFAYHARYAKIDEFTGFRAEELIRFTTVVLAALYALTAGGGGAAHRQTAEFRRAGAVLRGDRRDSAGEGFAV